MAKSSNARNKCAVSLYLSQYHNYDCSIFGIVLRATMLYILIYINILLFAYIVTVLGD